MSLSNLPPRQPSLVISLRTDSEPDFEQINLATVGLGNASLAGWVCSPPADQCRGAVRPGPVRSTPEADKKRQLFDKKRQLFVRNGEVYRPRREIVRETLDCY